MITPLVTLHESPWQKRSYNSRPHEYLVQIESRNRQKSKGEVSGGRRGRRRRRGGGQRMANSPCRSVARGSLEIPKSHCRARPMCRRPSTRYVSARNTLYYLSPFKRSKARDNVFPVITARRRRENFGTRDGKKLYRLVASVSSLASFELEKNCRSSGDWLLVQLHEICTG